MLEVLPPIVGLAGLIYFGFPWSISTWLVNAVKSVLGWLALGIALYVVAYVIRGKSVSGKFAGILSAVSILGVIALIVTLIGFVFLGFMGPNFVSVLRQVPVNPTIEQSNAWGQQLQAALVSANVPGDGIILGLIAIVLVLGIYSLGIVYLAVSDLLEKSRILTKVLAWLVVLGIWFCATLLISIV